MTVLRVSADDELCGLIQSLADFPGLIVDLRIPDDAQALGVFQAIDRAGFQVLSRTDLDGALRLRGKTGSTATILSHAEIAGHA